jgi:hypothetical protein
MYAVELRDEDQVSQGARAHCERKVPHFALHVLSEGHILYGVVCPPVLLFFGEGDIACVGLPLDELLRGERRCNPSGSANVIVELFRVFREGRNDLDRRRALRSA